MSKYKYPFIADKKMYAAVMGACQMICDTGWFNKATGYYADKYGVDEEELKKHIRARQVAGKKISAKRKYYYFAVEYSMGCERSGTDYFVPECARYTVKRGTSADNVRLSLCARDKDYNEYADVHWFGRVVPCETLAEATKKVEEWRNEQVAL